MRNIKRKFRLRKKPAATGAYRHYLDAKKIAPSATQEQLAEFILADQGPPTAVFFEKVAMAPFAFLRFVSVVKTCITDPDYAEGFYQRTGTVLQIPPGHEKAWAAKIAQALLIQPAVK